MCFQLTLFTVRLSQTDHVTQLHSHSSKSSDDVVFWTFISTIRWAELWGAMPLLHASLLFCISLNFHKSLTPSDVYAKKKTKLPPLLRSDWPSAEGNAAAAQDHTAALTRGPAVQVQHSAPAGQRTHACVNVLVWNSCSDVEEPGASARCVRVHSEPRCCSLTVTASSIKPKTASGSGWGHFWVRTLIALIWCGWKCSEHLFVKHCSNTEHSCWNLKSSVSAFFPRKPPFFKQLD